MPPVRRMLLKSILRIFFLEQALDTLLGKLQWNLRLVPRIEIPHTEEELIEYFDSGRARAELGVIYHDPRTIRYAISEYGMDYIIKSLELRVVNGVVVK